MIRRAKVLGLWCAALVLAGCDVDPAERMAAGNDLLRRGEYLPAAAAYQAAQVVMPDMPAPYYNAASALALSGQLDRAAAALQQALSRADTELAAKAYHNLGNVYFEMRDFAAAVEAYQQALRLNPGDADARYNLELALNRLSPPTPTPPPDVSPTPTPETGDPRTPTPTPQQQASPTVEASPPEEAPAPTASDGLSAAEAEQLLDVIQRGQQTLRERLQAQTPQAAPLEKDW